MYPFVHFGGLTLSSYKIITALAATLGVWLIFRRVTSIGSSLRQYSPKGSCSISKRRQKESPAWAYLPMFRN
jgi:hypothetical protein